MKSLVIIVIVAALAAGGYIFYKNRPAPAEPQSIENQVVEVEPEPAPMPEPEVVAPEPIPEAELPEVDFAQRAAEPFTTLTDKQGREIQAKVLSVIDDQIKLRRSDGLETSIPLDMLSEADIAFCEYLRGNIPHVAVVPTPVKTMPQGNLDSNNLEAQGGIDWDAIFGE